MDDSEDSSTLRDIACLMNKGHGYGGIFNHRKDQASKKRMEISTAQEWCDAVSEDVAVKCTNLRINDEEPPDCYVDINGRKTGIELVQLVDHGHKQRVNQTDSKGNGETPYAGQLFVDMQWSKERFFADLQKVIDQKNEKYTRRNITVDILLIHTAEPWLFSWQVNQWLEEGAFRAVPSFKCVFLMLGYEAGRDTDTWPVFRLYGDFPSTEKVNENHQD